jgi:hypothetical protein
VALPFLNWGVVSLAVRTDIKDGCPVQHERRKLVCAYGQVVRQGEVCKVKRQVLDRAHNKARTNERTNRE